MFGLLALTKGKIILKTNSYRLSLDLLACAFLIALSLVMFWVERLHEQGFVYLGWGADPEFFIWSLNWFPFAWVHHLPLLTTNFVRAPVGASLAWRTSVPALALLTAPFTLKYGALTSYNFLMMLAPGLTGAGAYLAAKELCGKTLPSFIAGLVFGFSSYEMGQSLGHLNLSFIVAIPLCLFIYFRAVKKNWSPLQMGISLGFLLLLSLEFLKKFVQVSPLFRSPPLL
ncbi:MAG: hypothetical protein B7Z81_00280 [Acidocella sp. 20-61-6]|nr:MAG: hypothetical protein B7Z81_00280 [Acidocella sp. 20-61-6]